MPGFNEDGVAENNPHLRRVSPEELRENEILDNGNAELDVAWENEDGVVIGRGVYLTIPCSPLAFTFSVDGPGTFTFDTSEATGFVGIEWVDDSHDAG